MTEVTEIHFSPSNTTKKVVSTISNTISNEIVTFDLLNTLIDFEGREFSKDELVIVGMPVFGGILPRIANFKLSKFKGNDTPAIAIVNYGNAAYFDALLQLTDLLKENGFKVIGAGTFVSQHSLFTKVAENRPDEKDIEIIKKFAKDCLEKFENNDFSEVKVPGNKPYREFKGLPFAPETDLSKCTFCFECVQICPVNAIPEDDPVGTDTEICMDCTACVTHCPTNARSFKNKIYKEANKNFQKKFTKRCEPELFL